MSEQSSSAGRAQIEGQMFLYAQPELLNAADHGELGLNPSVRPYEFARTVTAVPIAAAEIASAQRNYPIIFSGMEKPTLLAITGVVDGVNLFVNEAGEWDDFAYIPAYLRCHPFALVPRPDEQFAVVVDRAAPSISAQAEQPFFAGKELTPETQARVDFSAQYNSYRQSSADFCETLLEFDLLTPQQAKFTPDGGGEEQSIGSYVAVDLTRLEDLDAETLQKIHLDGTLSAIYGHSFSMDNWINLLERRKRRGAGA